MKRIHNRIDYNETGVFKINELTERYFYNWFNDEKFSWMKVNYLSGYQICNVYTNQETVLTALLKLNGEEATYQVVYDPQLVIVTEPARTTILKNIHYNDKFNCHGFTFLDGLFWFLLDSETAERIIKDDSYEESTLDNLSENGICLYYNDRGQLIHSARKVQGEILSKFGINDLITVGEKEILEKYKALNLDHNRTRYFNKQDM